MRRAWHRDLIAFLAALYAFVHLVTLYTFFYPRETALQDHLCGKRTIPVAVEIPSKINETISDSEFPFFVLHVGPPKTASTTIQCSLRKHQETLLKADDYHVLETVACRPQVVPREMAISNGNGNINNCFLELNKVESLNNDTTPECWKEYMTVIERMRKRGKHVVVSNEVISITKEQLEHPRFVAHLAESLKGFQVVVVTVYRRYFDWLPSCRSEMYSAHRRPGLHRFPRDGGMKVPSFERFYTHKFPARPYAFVDTIIGTFQQKFNIVVINLHGGDIETNFYCHGLPAATISCQAMLNPATNRTRIMNPATELDYDMLSTEARKRKLLPNVKAKLKRQQVVALAKEFHERTLGLTVQDFPKVCPASNVTDELLQLSLALEQSIMPKEYHANMETQLREEFARALDSKLFCAIDAEKVVEDSRWKDFFLGICL